MKTLLVLLILSTVASVFAQQAPDRSGASDLQIISGNWYLKMFDKTGDDDTFKAIKDQWQARDDKTNPERDRTSLSAPSAPPISEAAKIYVYELKVKNTGSKTIKAVS